MSNSKTFNTIIKMLDTLSTYFLISTKAEEARKRFYNLRIRDKVYFIETFPKFKACF